MPAESRYWLRFKATAKRGATGRLLAKRGPMIWTHKIRFK